MCLHSGGPLPPQPPKTGIPSDHILTLVTCTSINKRRERVRKREKERGQWLLFLWILGSVFPCSQLMSAWSEVRERQAAVVQLKTSIHFPSHTFSIHSFTHVSHTLLCACICACLYLSVPVFVSVCVCLYLCLCLCLCLCFSLSVSVPMCVSLQCSPCQNV